MRGNLFLKRFPRGLLISYLLTTYASAPSWIWALFTVLGVFVGLVSMIKFILSAMAALDRLEKEQKEGQRVKNSDLSSASSHQSTEKNNEEDTYENEE